MAIDYYKEGKWEELKKYCLDDTLITRELFDYGVKVGEINYMTSTVGQSSCRLEKYMEDQGNNQTAMTLPF
jgi:DEAD/DEAH box helicase domain-containing protein